MLLVIASPPLLMPSVTFPEKSERPETAKPTLLATEEIMLGEALVLVELYADPAVLVLLVSIALALSVLAPLLLALLFPN